MKNVLVFLLVVLTFGCSERFVVAGELGGEGGEPALTDDSGEGGEGGELAVATGGASATGGSDAGIGGSAPVCAEPYSCFGDFVFESVVQNHGHTWSCQDAQYCNTCEAETCRPGEFVADSDVDPWQCAVAWKDLGACQ